MTAPHDAPDSSVRLATLAELEAGLDAVRASPRDPGTLVMIVARPKTNERVELSTGELDPSEGLVGDGWRIGSGAKLDPDTQLTLMNRRAIALITPDPARWGLAGDQLYVDFDLSQEHLPPGQHLEIGTALVCVTAVPHTGCRKFSQRFGSDALKWVNSPVGKALRLRGVYARVVRPGTIRVGDEVRKATPA